ncbi:MAG TPA: DNA sulfur modification protein DndB [Pirellulales bacterium]|nr:DNA sulfur modification protein DndB [Pirellulales bacterium]
MQPFEYTFPVIRGTQAGREHYVTMCPLALVPRLFPADDSLLAPDLRAQRVLNQGRVPQIARYIAGNRRAYVLGALTASVDGDIRFEPPGVSTANGASGTLHVPMSARFVLHDGIHRSAAIVAALRQRPELADETIAIVLFADPGLKRAEQIFTDLKRQERRPARSLSILHDPADEMARLVRAVVARVPIFATHTEMQRSKISNRSTKLFTLSGIYHGTGLLLRGRDADSFSARLAMAASFWNAVAEHMADWQRAAAGEVTPADLRKRCVHAHALALAAIGRAGRSLLKTHPKSWRTKLRGLRSLDWSRSNTRLWEGRAMIAGRLSKATTCVVLTGNAIKQHLGLTLDDTERETERRFQTRR